MSPLNSISGAAKRSGLGAINGEDSLAAALPGAKRARISPAMLSPMLATPYDLPFDSPDWVFEPKMDGMRTICVKSGQRITLRSRRGLSLDQTFSHLIPELDALPDSTILDGEIVALDSAGRPSFELLLPIINRHSPKDAGSARGSSLPVYYVFDILHYAGFDLRDVRLRDRRAGLERILVRGADVRLIDCFPEHGNAAYESAILHGFEGIVAKRLNSAYASGKRSPAWRKIKAINSDEFVIGGYTRGSGWRSDYFASLLLGQFDNKGGLHYSGHVGTGFTETTLRELRSRMKPLETPTSPFIELPPVNGVPTWLSPRLVAEVRFMHRTREGRLRFPAFVRLRDDKPGDQALLTDSGRPSADVESRVDQQNFQVVEQLLNIGNQGSVEVDGYSVPLTNVDKTLWPASQTRRATTKRDLLVYLTRVEHRLLPRLAGRPLTLFRFPEGIKRPGFYQRAVENPPKFVSTLPISYEAGGALRPAIICDNTATLI